MSGRREHTTSRRRSRSPSREEQERSHTHRHHRRRRSRSPAAGSDRSSSEHGGPPAGVDELDHRDDYFVKATEFKLWLDEDRHKRFDKLSGEDARRYFKKFCKRWNRGELSQKYYDGIHASKLPASISSGHSWSFKNATQRELDDAASIRKDVDFEGRRRLGAGGGERRTLGPAMPPAAVSGGSGSGSGAGSRGALESLQDERERSRLAIESERSARRAGFARDRREAREQERDERGTAPGSRERMLEKKMEKAGANREFAQGKEQDMQDFGDEFLMGGDASSFQAAIAARDRAKARPSRRDQEREERSAMMSDRARELRSKEDETMAQFRAMAKERFG